MSKADRYLSRLHYNRSAATSDDDENCSDIVKDHGILESCENCCLCGKNTIKECSSCGWAYYCNKNCQTKHWLLHQHFCERMFAEQFEAVDHLRILPTTDEQLLVRHEYLKQTFQSSSGFPCCAICGDTHTTECALKRFAGLLLCNGCVEIQTKMSIGNEK